MSTPPQRHAVPRASSDATLPLPAWFLGPRAENASVWSEMFDHIFQDYVHWRRNYFPADPSIVGRQERRGPAHEAWLDSLTGQLDEILSELKFHFPMHSPRYNAHMISEQSLPAVLGYFAGLLYNPNNVSEEAAPITVSLELEVGQMIATMLGYDPKRAWAHICSGGTLATLEALWVARAVQFAPFVGREVCRTEGLDFCIITANGSEARLSEVDDLTLISLPPREAAGVLRGLAQYLHRTQQLTLIEASAHINAAVTTSAFNVARRGLGSILALTGLRPVVLVSAAAHYSIAKAGNVLGYGEDAVRLIPINDHFEVDIDALRRAIEGLESNEYLAAVVGIVGTTEEGAVDPIHKIMTLREEYQRKTNRSFWIHVDAAWGGYLRTLFTGLSLGQVPQRADPSATAREYIRTLDLHDHLDLDIGIAHADVRRVTVRWNDPDTYAAILAMADADSTTVDPHKMGYVPYPAGIVAFRDGRVIESVTQRAQYLSDEEAGVGSFSEASAVHALAPHILEGSKPGAAALACWLAHRTIPLTAAGHGQIVKVTLLSAQRLAALLTHHHLLFPKLEQARAGHGEPSAPFTFMLTCEPDTNLVCFVARPMEWVDGVMRPAPCALAAINRLNTSIYAASSIPGARAPHRLSAAQPFFLSRTRFEAEQYRSDSVKELLQRLEVSEEEYLREGLFVLRSTLMNPWHGEAREAGMDYLFEFVRFLHEVTAAALRPEALSGADRQIR